MSGVDENGNIILPSGQVYNPQMAVQNTLANLYGNAQPIPMAPVPGGEIPADMGVNRFLTGESAMPLVYDIADDRYSAGEEMPVYQPPVERASRGTAPNDKAFFNYYFGRTPYNPDFERIYGVGKYIPKGLDRDVFISQDPRSAENIRGGDFNIMSPYSRAAYGQGG
jgi:hypothetical protein